MERFYHGFSAVNSALKKAEMFLGCLSLGVLFLIMIFNAALRYLMGSGLNWSDELNGFLFVWFGFLAAAYAMSTDSHLRITAFVGLFPPVVRYALKQIMNILMIAMFLLYMGPLANLMATLPISNVLRFPMKWVYLILPIGFGLMCVHILFNMLQDTMELIRGKKEPGEGEKA
ncbi:TRAP transporter small permease [Pseudoflavonifractor phocaeensis]|uniref:TRAP transporter small permease n=1 Tax=Pseudoflavonifractor phocaeensis TaxID=1870988 RepID=UPI00308EE793|nr:C4-dicarboxylate ABC transporter [Oscillospiraceae bacterium]